MADAEWYALATQDLHAHLPALNPLIRDTLKTQAALIPDLQAAVSVLSIGCGNGKLDSCILGSVLPYCQTYYGVDTSAISLEQVGQVFDENHHGIKCHLANTKVEDWSGPIHPVDVALASHVLYYFDDVKKTIEHWMTWIKPGGYVISVISDSTLKIVERFNTTTYSNQKYRYSDFKRDIEGIRAKVVSENTFEYELNFQRKTRGVANFFMEKVVTDEEEDEFWSFMNSHFPSGIVPMRNVVTVLQTYPSSEDNINE